MRKIVTILLILVPFFSFAQKDIAPTDAFKVSGKVRKDLTVTLADIQKLESKKINDVVITNHLGETKSTIKNLQGVLLKTVLGSIEFDTESPKVLSELYLTLVASDGYQVVFSWNEIFNSATGDNLYLLTSKEGKELNDMNDRILTLCTTDFKTGRRYVKGLERNCCTACTLGLICHNYFQL